MKNVIRNHYARIGRRGGLASTPAKREAARRNVLKRWGRPHGVTLIPMKLLCDGRWYQGEGRNSEMGIWDARSRCFWTIALNDFANPASFPANSKRQVRLKREDYFAGPNGTFKPLAQAAKKLPR